jgi:hypothetical protein
MSELKLRRLIEHNQRLREDLGRPRIRVSEASASIIRYCKTTTDHLVSLYLLPLPLSPPPIVRTTREAPHSENLALSVTDASFPPVIGSVRVGPR